MTLSHRTHSPGFFIVSLTLILSALSLSSCKEVKGSYTDSQGNALMLIGKWGLVEVQYETAAVMDRTEMVPETLMEFMEDGYGRTVRVGDGSTLSTFRYEKYRGSVTLYTPEEWENNQGKTDEDSDYMPGKTYYFKVVDSDTMTSREKVSAGSFVTNVFHRF